MDENEFGPVLITEADRDSLDDSEGYFAEMVRRGDQIDDLLILLQRCAEVVQEVNDCIERGAGSDSYHYYVALKKSIVIKTTALLKDMEAYKEEP